MGGDLLGRTEVRDGNGQLIAIATQMLDEVGRLYLQFPTAAGMSRIQNGAVYLLFDARGGEHRAIAERQDDLIYVFAPA